MLSLKELYKGAKKTVVALVEDGRSQVIEYLELLDERSKKKMKALMKHMADTGILHGPDLFRHEGDGIYVFKVHHPCSARIFCFFDKNNVVVCTHGADKPGSRLKIEVKKAKEMRAQYLKQRSE
ncbi:MAG TPA: type II toxin-antitoxin system RelE/ParE family toxin [bacterium]